LALLGLTLHSHQMAVLLLPALALRLWQGRRWLTRGQWAGLALLAGLGLLPFFMYIRDRAAGRGFLEALLSHYTRGGTLDQALFDFSLAGLGRDAGLWLAFLALQFAGLALLLVLLGLWAFLREGRVDAGRWPASPWLVLLLFYAASAAFAFSYRVNDQYVFYLPGYLVAALFAGRGWQYLAENGGRLAGPRRALPRRLLLMSLLLVPPLAYNVAPRLLNAAGLNPMNIRSLPGRDPNWFFLWPGKGGYQGAADYGRAALAGLPPDAYLIADHTPLQTVTYYYIVEGLRPDIRLRPINPGQDLAPLVAELPAGARIFLADNNGAYYNLRSLPGAELRPLGVVYELSLPGP
jgi:hypothetical protein